MNKPIPIEFTASELCNYKRKQAQQLTVELIQRRFENLVCAACTVKAYGDYTTVNGCRITNILSERAIPRLKKGVDIAVSETRREFKHFFGCVFFEGGSREYGTSYHLHGILECPSDMALRTKFFLVLRRKIAHQVRKWINTNGTLTVPIWIAEMNSIEKYTSYCQRIEGGLGGIDKICFDMKSSYMPND